jgi:hypothetical protein
MDGHHTWRNSWYYSGMKLITDFRDYYDHAFDGKGTEFVRMANDAGPDKREQFRTIKDGGFKIPPVGTLAELHELDRWEEGRIRFVVAYTDPTKHVGEGKELWGINRWVSNPHMGMPGGLRHPEKWDTFCSAFVGETTNSGVSWRRLQVGPHVFWIEYTSETDWRSNCGEGDIELLEAKLNAGYHSHIRLPLFAVDFVHGANDMYAVDFNISPGIKGSGVERVMDAYSCVEALEAAHAHFAV